MNLQYLLRVSKASGEALNYRPVMSLTSASLRSIFRTITTNMDRAKFEQITS